MELTHQLTPMLRTLRLSGILETLDVRNRQAVEQRPPRGVPHPSSYASRRRAQSQLGCACAGPPSIPQDPRASTSASIPSSTRPVFDLATCHFIERHETS
jgi:hypothetical protein